MHFLTLPPCPIPGWERLPFRPLLLRAAALIALAAPAVGGEWPGFRGPTGMGISEERDLPVAWGGPGDANLLWKVPLPPTLHEGEPDHNQSSPIVADGRVIVTTAHWPPGADRTAVQPSHRVACYHCDTGALLWDTPVPPGPWTLTDLRGGYAAPTPAVCNGRIFAVFGSSVLHALDLSGRHLWSHVIPDHGMFDVALPVSPIVHDDTVILLLDRKAPASTILALDAATGEVRWEKKRPDCDFGHMTPVLAPVNGTPQLLVCASRQLQGINPDSGDIIWSCDWGQSIWPVSSPILAEGLVYAIGGRGGHPGVVVDPTGSGDVTATHRRWSIGPMSEGLSSPVAFGGLVYRIASPGVVRCVRISDGHEWFRERLPRADPSVSPIATADGRIYFASAGRSVVLRAGTTLEILGESDLGDPSLAAPAVSDGRLFLKGARFLHAVGAEPPAN